MSSVGVASEQASAPLRDPSGVAAVVVGGTRDDRKDRDDSEMFSGSEEPEVSSHLLLSRVSVEFSVRPLTYTSLFRSNHFEENLVVERTTILSHRLVHEKFNVRSAHGERPTSPN